MALFTQVDADAHMDIDKEIRKYKALIRALCARRNTHTAISKLPNEIISHIFIEFKKTLDGDLDMKATRDTKNTTDYLVRLLIVAAVCSRWRQVALDTATLWSTLLLDRPAWVAGTFKRSKHAPLTVLGPLWRLTSHESDETPANMLSSITDAASRFQHVDIRVTLPDMYRWDTPGLLFRSHLEDQAVQAPLLRTLSIDYTRSNEDCVNRSDRRGNRHRDEFPPLMIPFPCSEPTSLQSLTLRNLVPIAVPSMPSLTHLSIQLDHLENVHFLSVPRVIEVLRNVPVVESISLSTVSSDDSVVLAPPNPTSQLVHLPYLKELNILSRYIKESIIFVHLHAPALRRTVIEYHNDRNDPIIQSNGDLSHIHRQIARSIPSDVSDLKICVSTNVTALISPYGGSEFWLTVREDREDITAPEILKLCIPGPLLRVQEIDIFQSLPLGRITSLDFCGVEPDEEEEALIWSRIVAQLERLRYLGIINLPVLSMLGVPPESSLPDLSINIPVNRVARGDNNQVFNPELETVELIEFIIASEECEFLRPICSFRHGRQRPLRNLWLTYFRGVGRKVFENELKGYGTSIDWAEINNLESDSDDDGDSQF